MLLCSCCENFEGIGVRIEEDYSYLGIDWWVQALHSIIPTLASFEDVGGLLLIKFLSKCVFWVYFESIWAFSSFLWWEKFWKSRKCYWCKIWLYCVLYMDAVLLMQNLRFLHLKWINFDLTCLTSPLPILTSCEDIGG